MHYFFLKKKKQNVRYKFYSFFGSPFRSKIDDMQSFAYILLCFLTLRKYKRALFIFPCSINTFPLVLLSMENAQTNIQLDQLLDVKCKMQLFAILKYSVNLRIYHFFWLFIWVQNVKYVVLSSLITSAFRCKLHDVVSYQCLLPSSINTKNTIHLFYQCKMKNYNLKLTCSLPLDAKC